MHIYSHKQHVIIDGYTVGHPKQRGQR